MLEHTEMHPARISQLVDQFQLMLFAVVFLRESIRFSACRATKIAAALYVGLILWSLAYLIHPFGYGRLLEHGHLILICGIAVLLSAHFTTVWIGRH